MLPPPPNGNNPFESTSLKTTSPHQSPTPKSPLFNFPSPFLDEHESPLNQIFSQIESTHNPNQHYPTKRSNLGKSKIEAAAPPANGLGIVPRRRAGKKDRHSKICTAQGIRDRRMRLSLQVARKFFDLQDMLGYDKASKTIEWLFTQSEEAINELADEAHQGKTESFVSECEDLSGIEETNSSNVVPNPSRPSMKESREKARERARCRTREKMLVRYLQYSGDSCVANSNSEVGKLGFSNCPFEGVDQDQEIRVSPFESSYNSMEQQLSENFSDYVDPSSSSSSGLMGFLGNWDDRTNCFHYSLMNQVSYGGNLNSVYSATSEFQ